MQYRLFILLLTAWYSSHGSTILEQMSSNDALSPEENPRVEGENVRATGDDAESALDALLKDPNKKAALLRKMGLDDPPGTSAHDPSHPTPSGKSTGGWPHYNHPTPSGKSMGGCSGYPPAPFWPTPFPYPGFPPFPTWGFPDPQPQTDSRDSPCDSESATHTQIPGPSSSRKRTQELTQVDEEDEDSVLLLDDSEALELIEFDPSVEPKDTWSPPTAVENFLQKYFNRTLEEGEREAILKDFPKPNCKAAVAPRLDDQVKEQLKRKGRDPNFGAEKSLFKIQEHLLDVTGPLTCLWADLLNKDAGVTPEDTLLLVQRALVLVGSVSHSITLERRKIAWLRINPKLKSLASEEYKERESNLFGPGFLAKASKRLEVEKTLDKVSNQGKAGPSQKRPRYDKDKSDLRSFLAKGASAGGGSKMSRQNNPRSSYTRFKSNRYFRPNVSKAETTRSVEFKEKPK